MCSLSGCWAGNLELSCVVLSELVGLEKSRKGWYETSLAFLRGIGQPDILMEQLLALQQWIWFFPCVFLVLKQHFSSRGGWSQCLLSHFKNGACPVFTHPAGPLEELEVWGFNICVVKARRSFPPCLNGIASLCSQPLWGVRGILLRGSWERAAVRGLQSPVLDCVPLWSDLPLFLYQYVQAALAKPYYTCSKYSYFFIALLGLVMNPGLFILISTAKMCVLQKCLE